MKAVCGEAGVEYPYRAKLDPARVARARQREATLSLVSHGHADSTNPEVTQTRLEAMTPPFLLRLSG